MEDVDRVVRGEERDLLVDTSTKHVAHRGGKMKTFAGQSAKRLTCPGRSAALRHCWLWCRRWVKIPVVGWRAVKVWMLRRMWGGGKKRFGSGYSKPKADGTQLRSQSAVVMKKLSSYGRRPAVVVEMLLER